VIRDPLHAALICCRLMLSCPGGQLWFTAKAPTHQYVRSKE